MFNSYKIHRGDSKETILSYFAVSYLPCHPILETGMFNNSLNVFFWQSKLEIAFRIKCITMHLYLTYYQLRYRTLHFCLKNQWISHYKHILNLKWKIPAFLMQYSAFISTIIFHSTYMKIIQPPALLKLMVKTSGLA